MSAMHESRIESRIATIVNDGGLRHREIVVSFVTQCGVFTMQLYGHNYAHTENGKTSTCFTFSPSLTPFDLAAFRKFVWNVKNRSNTQYIFNALGDHTAFTLQDGTLSINATYRTNVWRFSLRLTDMLCADLDTLAGNLEQYLVVSDGHEIREFASVLTGGKSTIN